MNKKNNILICPLEWGLGHAGRMIPLALKLKSRDQNVFIASGEDHLAFFKQEAPGLTCINFPGFRMKYSGRRSQFLTIFLRIPLLLFHIIREHILIKRIIREYSIDIIISDSRPGLWNRKIKSVFVFHMPRVPLPEHLKFLEGAGMALTRFFMKKYTFCFIPDLDGKVNVSGRLSHELPLPRNVRFIGILSRFSAFKSERNVIQENPFYTVILSGPEPQRSILKEKLSDVLIATGKPTVILEGNPGNEETIRTTGNTTYISHLPANKMAGLILNSKIIITRSGYTILMELISLGRSAIIIPTPGQSEQEYLADYMANSEWFSKCSQDNIGKIPELITPAAKWPETIMEESENLLNAALYELLQEDHKNV